MSRAPIAALAMLLGACSEHPASSPSEKTQTPAPAAAPVPPPPASKGRMVEETNDLLEFTYGWPSEAAAIPKLEARLEAELSEFRADALKIAREDEAERGPEIPFHGHYLSKVWELHGNTPRLLSIAAEVGTFTGGAHGNSVFDTILWDRTLDRPIEVADLFTSAAAFEAMTPAYCGELDKQRAEKREETLPLKGDDWMTQCRPLVEQTVAPVDSDKDGRFDLIRVLIEPYNSGPYAEGSYIVDVPVTPELLKVVKKEYAAEFELGGAAPDQPQ